MLICQLLYLLCWQGDDHPGLLGQSLRADFKIFSTDSPWNTPIPENPELDSFSQEMINRLEGEGKNLRADYRQWTIPLYVIDATKAPTRDFFREKGYYPSVADPKDKRYARKIPFPKGIHPDPKRDGHLLLVDPKLRKTWDFSRLKYSSEEGWTASRIDVWDLDGTGTRTPFSGKRWWTGGARGSGMPLIAGLIRPEEIKAGVINHALAFACPNIRVSPYDPDRPQLCKPAHRSDGRQIGFTYLPMGARMQLDPNLDLDKLGLSRTSKIIAKAMQTYGMYLCDGANGFKIYFQNMGPDDPKKTWSSFGKFNDLHKIPIQSFRILKCEYVIGQR